ncbi:MAG: hypothetical protein CFH37_01213, partial [Alphaproteobacteria bacterium MarineAlpha9_Bin7]
MVERGGLENLSKVLTHWFYYLF